MTDSCVKVEELIVAMRDDMQDLLGIDHMNLMRLMKELGKLVIYLLH